MTDVTAGYFLNNRALFQGGAIYADISSTTHLAIEFNHTVAQGIFGGCYLLFGNERRFIGAKVNGVCVCVCVCVSNSCTT